jgi:hypothetical protein
MFIKQKYYIVYTKQIVSYKPYLNRKFKHKI